MTFQIATTQTLGAAQIDSTNIAEPSGADPVTLWSAATNYAAGAEVYSSTSHKAYRAIQASGPATAVKDPSVAANVAPPNATDLTPYFWLDMGATNKFAPFDRILSKVCSGGATIKYRLISTAAMNCIGLYGLFGRNVAVSIYDTDAARRNLITYSQQATNAAYATTGVTTTANAATDHIWGNTATSVQENAVGGNHFLQFPSYSFTSGLAYTASAYVKRIPVFATRNVALRLPVAAFSTTPQAIFDLDALTVTNSGGGTGAISYDAATGYYRISVTATADTTAAGRVNCYVYNAALSYVGNGNSGYYISGCQLEQASAVSGYQWIEDATRWGDLTFADYRNITLLSGNGLEAIFTGATADAGDFIDITILPDIASGLVQVTEIALGYALPLGALLTSNVSSQDFSTKTYDDFGNVTLIKRVYAAKNDYTVKIARSSGAQIRNFLNYYRGTALMFYEDTHLADFGLSAFGWWADYNIPVKGSISDTAIMTLSVQGLS